MSKITIPLTEATPKQLREFATVSMGLDVPPTSPGNRIIALIQSVDHNVTEIEVEATPVAEQAPIANAAKPAALKDTLSTHYSDDPKITLTIPSIPGKGGDRDVQIAVNGDVVLMKRDVPAEVPYRFYIALKDAVEKDISQTLGKPGEPAQIIVRDVLSYPFMIDPTTMPSKEEIAAWERRMARIELGEPVKAAA